MPDFCDELESLDPAERERRHFLEVPKQIARAMKAPGWAAHLAGIEPRSITSRAALAKLPVLRKSDIAELQKKDPPFGGLTTKPAGTFHRLLMSPGPIFEPQAEGPDGYGAARACFAAGFRRDDIVHNSFAYHLTPGGFILESGCFALGCAVVPGGVGNTEQQLDAIGHYRPVGYVGTPDFLKILLDTAEKTGKDASSIKRALVSGAALPASLRAELKQRGVAVVQCYATAELGVIAYESEAILESVARSDAKPDSTFAERAPDGMIVNESVIVEIVRPGTGDPVAEGEVGEMVVTSFNIDYPMIRLATGDMSAFLPGVSPCGRTNMRIKGWMGRADQTAKIKGMFVHPKQVAEVAARHAQLTRLRLVVGRENEQDTMTLLAECAAPDGALEAALAETLQSVTKLKGVVKLVAPGSLPNDGKVISDERAAG
jgi:phenylacetate-CoA ligase